MENEKPLGQMIIEMDLDSSKFTNSMTSVKRAVKSAETEMKANMAVYDAAGDHLGKLQAQYDGLGKKLKVNKAYLEKLKQAYEDEVKASGKSSVKAQKLANDFNKQVAAVANVEKQLKSTQIAINRFHNKGEQSVVKLGLAFGKLNDKAKELGKTMTTRVTPVIGAMGIAIGKVASDFDTSGTHIENALDLTKKQLEQAKETAKKLYTEGFGESLDDVTNAIVQVKQNMKGLNDVDLSYATKSAITLGKEFESDVNEVTRAGNSLMQNYGLTAKQSFDLMAKGAKNGMNFSNEMFDNMSEYTINFKEAGFSAKEMFSILSNGAQKGYNLDRLNDTLLEFKLQSEDSGKSYTSAMKSMSKDTQQVFKDYENGKATVSDLYKAVIPDLEKMRKTLPDKEFNTIGKALFGTKWEDQGADVVLSMKTINKTLDNTDGTMKKMSDNSEKTFGQRFQGILRSTGVALEPLGNTLLDLAEDALPHVEKGIASVTKWFDNMSDKGKYVTLGIAGIAAVLPPVTLALRVFTKPLRIVWGLFDKIPNKGEKVKKTFNGIKNVISKVTPSLNTLKKVATTIGKGIKTGLSFGAKGAVSAFKLLSKGLGTVFKVVTKLAPFLRVGLGAALRFLTGPIGWVITGISLLTAGFKYAYKHSDTFRKKVDAMKNGIVKVWNVLKKLGVKGTVKLMWSYVTKKFSDGYTSIKNKVGKIKAIVTDTFETIKTSVSKKVSSMIKTVKNMPSKMANGIAKGASAMKSGAKKMLNGLIGGVEWGVNKGIYGVNWILDKLQSKKQIPSLELAKYAKGTSSHPGGLAMVNDASGSNYHEIVQTPDGQTFIPQGRNVVMNLPKGTQVLDGNRTRKLSGSGFIPKYKDGKGTLSKITDKIFGFFGKPKELLSKVFSAFTNPFNGLKGSIVKGTLNTVKNNALGFISSLFSNLGSSSSGSSAGSTGSNGVASSLNSLASMLAKKFNLRITSGYRPGSKNELGQPDDHSKGKAIDLGGSYEGMWAAAQAAAKLPFVKYVINRNMWTKNHGMTWTKYPWGGHMNHTHISAFANGGIVTKPTLGLVGEAGSEAIIPLTNGKRSRALDILAQVSARFLGSSPSSTTTNNEVINQLIQQNEMMQQQNQLLYAILAKDNGVYLDGKQIKKSIDKITAKENRTNRLARGLT